MNNNVIKICPKCNALDLYKCGKDNKGYQKFMCKSCKHPFAPDRPSRSINLKLKIEPPIP